MSLLFICMTGKLVHLRLEYAPYWLILDVDRLGSPREVEEAGLGGIDRASLPAVDLISPWSSSLLQLLKAILAGGQLLISI